MTRDEIIRMAREAGWGGDAAEAWADGYEAGVAEEREACAKVCDELAANDKLSNYYRIAAKAIRERGNQ